MSNTTQQVPYYIIVSAKKDAIWQGIYDSKPEAELELKTQMSMLPHDQRDKADWKVETRFKMVKMTGDQADLKRKFDEF